MVWKIALISALLWFLRSMLHLSVPLTVLIGIVAATAMIAELIVSSHRLAAFSRKL